MTKHILTIDDEESIRQILVELLTAEGYRVSTADSAQEALRVVKEDPPHLIISDLQMEDADGLELIEKMKESLPSLPIILLTGVTFDPEVIQESISQKVSVYLTKTSSLQKLLQAVQRLLGDVKPDGSPSI